MAPAVTTRRVASRANFKKKQTNDDQKKPPELEIICVRLVCFFQSVGQVSACTAERRHKQGAPLLFDNGGAPAGSAVIPFAFFVRGQMNLTDGCVTQTLD